MPDRPATSLDAASPLATPLAEGRSVVQIGWMDPKTSVMCDCPVYERSPHANSVPVYREAPGESVPVTQREELAER